MSDSAAPSFGQVDVKAMPGVLKRIIRLALHYPGGVALAIGCSLGSAIASLTLPKLFGHAVDQATRLLSQGPTLAEDARNALLVTAGLVILASTVRGFLTGFAGYVAEVVSQKVGYDLRIAFFQQLQRLSFGFHDRIHSGDLITRGMLDLEGARAFIQGGMMQTFTLVLLLTVATAMMFATDSTMAVIGLLFVPIAGFVLARMGFLLRVTWLKVQQLQSILTLTMEENLQGIRVVRAFSGKKHELSKFDRSAEDVLQYSYKRITLRFRAISVMTLSFYGSMALLLWYGGHKVAAGQISVGKLTEFLTYMTLLQTPIRQIAMIFASAARATSSGGRLFEVLDLEPDIADAPGAQPLKPAKGVLRFEHVDFAYDAGRPILQDISFQVGPGETIGIVGPPGSGKSTIAQLIPRFYDVTGGRITIDGQDVREVTTASLREYVGLVQQEAFLFDTTVTNNIAYADPWASEDRIVGASRTAQLHDYIAALPGGYETRVGERGVALSGGQRQRMSIARGVVPGPGIMIFDDSTAAIDAVTEKKVREGIKQATRSMATVIIAHRLSSLMHADEILVIDEGRVIERGTHPELIAKGGVYADLYALQTRTEQGGVIDDEAAPAAAPTVEAARV
ncbi:ABC transporter ATP-binding protein [Phenylobacterium sp.]|jgi:ATP-binding cassette subfamily B protein|uniref:ABC transporter ATP-binding protein n=1 Tax=Phenylobacterium sp. TaxID=1871053 RepID=UPI002E33F386|nr:ABC transporter ATP-binding protein [Phenylobacterium sp.]HEX2561199.1 ABC transporter ATP-binding protein [Phenylobacterium sp.]